MNHDVTHCLDWQKDCPIGCYRAEVTEDLENPAVKTRLIGIPLSYAHFEGTNECLKTNGRPRMTNADWIRQMTDEELARVLACQDNWTGDECSFGDCLECMIEWLKKER